MKPLSQKFTIGNSTKVSAGTENKPNLIQGDIF